MRTHRRYERFIQSPPAAPSSEATLVTAKAETLEIFGLRRTFFDLVLRSKDRLIGVPFVEYDPVAGNLIYPARLLPLGSKALNGAGQAALKWFKSKGSPTKTVLDFFTTDADLLRVIKDAATTGTAVRPETTGYSAFFAAMNRYEHAATRAAGRRVLDLRAGLGAGAALLRPHAATVAAVNSVSIEREIARRFGAEIHGIAPSLDYDVIAAFALDPAEMDEWIERAAAYLQEGSRVVLSFFGDHVDALKERAESVQLLVPPANDVEPRFAETIVWFEPHPKRSFLKPEVTAHTPATSERKVSVLFVLRSNAPQFPGGDSIQVYSTAQALCDRGHNAVVTLTEEPDATGYDIVHLSNMTIPHDTLRAATAVERSGAAIVLMPIFIDHADEGAWGYRATLWAYNNASLDEEQLELNLKRVENREIGFAPFLAPPERSEMEAGYFEAQRALLAKTDYLLANAYSEVHRIYRYVDSSVPFSIVPSCTDAGLYGKSARARFVERYGLDDFILMTGRFEPRKNQLAVAYKFRDSGRRLVFIGRNQFAPFGLMMRMYWPDNLTVFRFMSEEELAGAYAAARVLAIPSWDEVVSLSSLNGAVSETSLVLSRNGYEHEYFGSLAHYCDPGSADDIARAIDAAWEDHEAKTEERAEMSRRVRKDYTWARAAELTERAYFRLLADNPRGRERLHKASS